MHRLISSVVFMSRSITALRQGWKASKTNLCVAALETSDDAAPTE